MADLQSAFYIVGIVYMGLMLVITLVALTAVLVIRSKINAIHHHLEAKLATAADWAHKGEAVVGALKKVSRVKRK